MNNSSGSHARSGPMPVASSLRPRIPRLISGFDENEEVAFDPVTASVKRVASAVQSPFGSRSASPIPSQRLSRPSTPPVSRRNDTGKRNVVGGSLRAHKQGSSVSLAGLWGSSWTTIQGIASDLLGEDTSPQKQTTRRRRNSSSKPDRRPTSALPSTWGPSAATTAPATSYIATGSREQREALVRAQKRKDLLSGGATEYADALGRFKRRSSEDRDSASAPPGETENRDALVYVHHVQVSDTLAGITIRYGCQAATLRKANRMWPNDSVQVRKTLVLPVDACVVKGKPVPPPGEADLLSSFTDDTPTPTVTVPEPRPESKTRSRNESISTTSDRPSSSLVDTDPPWTHDSWVMLPNQTSPTEIARLSRRTLGYFPPARRKSQSYSDLDTPSTSLDIARNTLFENHVSVSPGRTDIPQRPRGSRRLSNANNGYFPSYLAGPGGVGTMAKNVKSPGPAQDGLNKLLASHLPNVAPPPNQRGLYLPDLPVYTDYPEGAPGSGFGTPLASGTQSPNAGNLGLENMGAAVEGWLRKMATKAQTGIGGADGRAVARASVGVPGQGGGGIGDLIEMADAFEIGGDEADEGDDGEDGRGRQGSMLGDVNGTGAVGSSFSAGVGKQTLRERGRSGTSAGPKGRKDD